MPHDVIMPALGMAQETGKIVAWLKQPGDVVKAGEALMEVETDKAVMEVEAPGDGYLTQIQVAAGDDVPVGNVVALISAAKPDAASDISRDISSVQKKGISVEETITPKSSQEVLSEATSTDDPVTVGVVKSTMALPSPKRILSSPKTRRLATEGGLDLTRLVSLGRPQPYHVADLTILREQSPGLPPVAGMATTSCQITARAPMTGVGSFLAWLHDEGGITVTAAVLWSKFAAGALRRAILPNGEVVILLSVLNEDSIVTVDPDRSGLSAVFEDAGDKVPDLILRDLTKSTITSIRRGDHMTPTLNIGSDGANYLITFDFPMQDLTEDAAIAFVTGFTDRLADPLHHLF